MEHKSPARPDLTIESVDKIEIIVNSKEVLANIL